MSELQDIPIDSDNPATLERTLSFFAAINRHDSQSVLAHFHPDVHYRFMLGAFPESRGKDEVAAAWAAMTTTFPDVHERLVEVIVRSEIAVAHWVLTGTLSGPLPLGNGIAVPQADESSLAVRGVDILHFRDGLIIRKDSLVDPTAWFEAYGVGPAAMDQSA